MRIVIVISALAALSACSEVKSVGYYKTHGAERARRLDICVDTADFSHDCRNVRQAQFETDGLPAKDGASTIK
uniref:EexN family lipoprotein n=1 Tax=uncultured Sphingomonas sp. TaxID=158754 RepID=UPI0035CC9EA0